MAGLAFRITPVRDLKIGKAPHFGALSTDGRYLFVTNFASDQVQVIDCQTNQLTDDFYAGYEPLGIAVSPLDNKIFVTNYRPGLVKVIDANTYEIIDDIKVGGLPNSIAMSPKGYQVFVTNFGRGKIGRVDFIDTSTHRILGEVEVGIRPLAVVVSASPTGCTLHVVALTISTSWISLIEKSSRKSLSALLPTAWLSPQTVTPFMFPTVAPMISPWST